jgi:hypothetical protein
MITHTLKNLEAVDSPADRAKARGFVERAGMVACMGVPRSATSTRSSACPSARST